MKIRFLAVIAVLALTITTFGATLAQDTVGTLPIVSNGVTQNATVGADPTTFTARWTSSGIQCELTLTRKSGESNDAFAARCHSEVRAQVTMFPVDGPQTRLTGAFAHEPTVRWRSNNVFCELTYQPTDGPQQGYSTWRHGAARVFFAFRPYFPVS